MAAEPGGLVQAQPGLGTQCSEAQADGVPCACLGMDCEECSRRRVTSAAAGLPVAQRPHA